MGQRILVLPADVFIGLLRRDRRLSLPADLKVVGVSAERFFSRNEIALRVESSELSDILPGHELPVLELTFSAE